MEYTGLIQKFKVNRPLTDEERALQLRQERRLEIKPEHQLSVIRMNSTFLELVDVYFSWKGILAFAAISGWLFTGGLWSYSSLKEIIDPGPHFQWWDAALVFVVASLLAAVFAWIARFECFRFTHYPMRFNRKTRTVHVFRTDGTVLTARWDDLFFCLGRSHQPRYWTIQGHVLAQDGKTVLETFSFPQSALGDSERDLLRHVWEYVRRYMDEGPAPLISQTPVVLPIADRRERFLFGWHRTHAIWTLLLLPVYVLFYPGRWIAMRTSSIPRWPQAVEVQCAVESGDAFVRDVSTNPSWAR